MKHAFHEHTLQSLETIAKKTLEANIRVTANGSYLAAGGHQFGSLWTRDFCFAARGLLAIGRSEVVRHHLSHLIESRREDGVIARVLESVPSWRRVAAHTVFQFLPDSLKRFPIQQPLFAEHLGEHGTVSIDSNALVLRAVADLQRRAPDEKWLQQNRPALNEILNFCLMRTNGGSRLVEQGRFEDWQDSAAREGQTCYVNLVFALAFRAARELDLAVSEPAYRFDEIVFKHFFVDTTGLLHTQSRSGAVSPIVSADSNLLWVSERLLDASSLATSTKSALLDQLMQHPLWTAQEIPGRASFPDYPATDISWTTKGVGLTHYHDQFLWSWLSGLAAIACIEHRRQHEAERIFSVLETMARRDGGIGEVYRREPGLPLVHTWLYHSELPFSWGAGLVLEAIEKYRETFAA
jgi:hypothetical protein